MQERTKYLLSPYRYRGPQDEVAANALEWPDGRAARPYSLLSNMNISNNVDAVCPRFRHEMYNQRLDVASLTACGLHHGAVVSALKSPSIGYRNNV